MTHEEEMNKAAELWIAGVFLAYSVPDTSVKELREIAEKSFIAGYKLAMEQGETKEEVVFEANPGNTSCPMVLSSVDTFKVGDKVIVQIRKKDE